MKLLFVFSIFLVFSMGVSSFYVVYADQAIGKPGWEVMSDKVCGDKLCSEIDSDSDSVAITPSSIAYFSPPLKQISQGIDPSNVTCTEGKVMVLKQSNGVPACVNPSSVEKLITRGWAVHILPDYNSQNNNSEIFTQGNHSTISDTVTYFGDVSGYLAKPVTDGSYPGVVMIHEWWGLNDNIKEMADKLASHGYIVLAVDLYGGQVATTSNQARQLITTYDLEQGIQNMNSAVFLLNNDYSANKIGSIGWCFGGGQSLNLALYNDDMDATVIYYGSLVTETETLSSIQWPVLGIFAELDKGIPVNTVIEFESSLNELDVENYIHVYDNVDHAFANPSGDRYAPEESGDAWAQTISFLESTLK
ncbi:MAG: dienelactone hydrolase family protein [Nitrosopumilus sp.]|nr:dienelactone hydrolase family protein [Nitrosopumilus sp.]